MAKEAPYTQAAITRAIKAALKAGLIVTGVKPDGTVLTAMPSTGLAQKEPWEEDNIPDAALDL